MDKKFQVFVSSTFADLIEERRAVMQTLLKMPCIPAGMELFPAKDEEQLRYIKRVIDDCDYYLLIIGGRYGSMTIDGISYTEQEYDYAVSKKLHVIALLHGSPETLPLNKSEGEPAVRERLEAFRARVKTGRLVSFWNSPADLPGLVALGMQSAMTEYPAVGWVRADRQPSEDLLSDMNALRKENERLAVALSAASPSVVPPPDLAGWDEPFTVSAKITSGNLKHTQKTTTTWAEIFSEVAPTAQAVANSSTVKYQLGLRLFPGQGVVDIDDHNFETIEIQMQALGVIELERSITVSKTWGMFWKLTPLGARRMVEMRAIRSSMK